MSDRIDDFAYYPAAEQFHPIPYACYSAPQGYATMSDHVGNFVCYPAAEQFHPVPDSFYSAPQGYIEDVEGSSPAPSTSRRGGVAMAGHTRGRRFEKPINRYIPDLLCRERECLTIARFLSPHLGKHGFAVEQNGVLLSSLYVENFMYEETASELDCKPRLVTTKPCVDPRGDWFKPIATSGIYVWLNRADPVWVEFNILPGSGAEVGVRFILGRRDIKRIWGDSWTPQQYDEGLPMRPEAIEKNTFHPLLRD
ncbi:hypothetical protein MMYC01_200041 [Madurella mycetomatis]|uniref:Uncharacterized protein n=1 Tax=Madurella mycetomatis TaxID=100816 RepID=A0A150ASE5_9PEZI|nr:hypothetical protein MMYC01_200041 [Madurella mycetomatis]